MEQQMTALCDLDPMMDDVKVLVRCISIWKSHAKGKPNQPWGLDVVLQDPEGNRVQAAIKLENMNKFLAVLDEGSCYRIGNFGVGENGGKYPLLNHRYKMNFYKNTSITRVNHFDQNLHGFKFEPFQNFRSRVFGSTETVDVIGTIVSISNLIPFESYGKEKNRRTVILQDVDGQQLECSFYEEWAEKFNGVAAMQSEENGPVVMILQLAKVKYFNEKPSITNSLFATKLYLNDKIPEISAFRQRYEGNDGYDEKNHAISLYSPVKKEVTIEDFFAGGVKKLVGSIRESGYEYIAIVYARVHKIHREHGWTYIGCKRCGGKVKEIDPVEARAKTSGSSSSKTCGSSSSKATGPPKRFWWCKKHELVEAVVSKYKVIVRVIDDTGSASLLLFDDMINTLVGIPCYKLKEKYAANAEDIFPEELIANIVGKRLLFRFEYTEYNINNNHHVYQVKLMSEDPGFIKFHKKAFIHEDDDEVLETPAPTIGANKSKLQYQDSVPFNIEDTPKPKGKEISVGSSGIVGTVDGHAATNAGDSVVNDKGKRTIIDLDEYDEDAVSSKRAKKPMVAVKIEKP